LTRKNHKYIITLFATFVIFTIGIGLNQGSAVIQSYKTNDSIGNSTYSDWIGRFWQWWINLKTESIPTPENPTPKCLLGTDDSNKTIFLMDNFLAGSVKQQCTIKADQSILIPLYTAECDTGDRGQVGKPFKDLLACAFDADRGNAHFRVNVDNASLVDKVVSVHKTPADDHLAEVESKKFYEVNVLPGTQFIGPGGTYEGPGKYLGAAHGWFVFLKPLNEGNHVITYSTDLTGTADINLKEAPWDYKSDIKYNLRVEKP